VKNAIVRSISNYRNWLKNIWTKWESERNMLNKGMQMQRMTFMRKKIKIQKLGKKSHLVNCSLLIIVEVSCRLHIQRCWILTNQSSTLELRCLVQVHKSIRHQHWICILTSEEKCFCMHMHHVNFSQSAAFHFTADNQSRNQIQKIKMWVVTSRSTMSRRRQWSPLVLTKSCSTLYLQLQYILYIWWVLKAK
jgi:hypothetical protein